jgi:hypothetical protein
MNHLLPCPACQRHVRVRETSCPFCGAGLALSDSPPPVLPRARLGRAALFAFGATIAGAAACGGETTSSTSEPNATSGASGSTSSGAGGTTGAGGSGGASGASTDSAVPDVGGGVVLYGAPPPPRDAGPDAGDAPDAPDTGGGIPIYGSPPP